MPVGNYDDRVNDLLAHVEENIRARGLFRRGQAILVAVSGGVDSMVLLHVLHALATEHRWRLVVAHFNHRLRGVASDADERSVCAAAERLELEYVSERAAAHWSKAGQGTSVEMKAREWRHTFFGRAALERGCEVVALAHHADDQVELFFLRLLRGSGGRGLAGMGWSSPALFQRGVELVRPLLDVSKADLLAAVRAAGIAVRHDRSNDDQRIPRNRIRHELLPLLASAYCPAVTQTVLRSMEIIGADHAVVEALAARWLASRRRGKFERLPLAVQRQCLHQQLIALGASPEFEFVESLRLHPDRVINGNGATAFWRDDAGSVHRRELAPARFNPNTVAFDLAASPGEGEFAGVRFSWRLRRLPRGSNLPDHEDGCEFFSASGQSSLLSEICLRHWRAGDRFQPIGMARPVKLQDLFTNLKIPRARRRELIVAETRAGEIFWVEGVRIGEQFKLTPASTRMLEWRWQR